ncbi:DUF4177 domain-containing protein [Roseobacter sp.]|uniref:DUF4177 domain-containing protein n=1 Tax=Roseobacter sp. TaxID=1907202 RepID=UPI00329699B9
MPQYQYRVIPAPTRGVKAKGIKTPEDRFSNAVEGVMNDMAADGWEYQRAETLPATERAGFRSTKTEWRNVLVFRKLVTPPVVQANHAPSEPRQEPQITTPQTPEDDASHSAGASRMLSDNGVEEPSDVAGMTNSLTQLAATRNKEKTDA